MHLPLACLSSLLLFKKKENNTKAAGASHKKVFQMKTSACRDGTLKNQPNKIGMIPQYVYIIPTSCAILPTMHNRNLSTHSLNEHGTQHCSLHSLPHKRQSISDSATFSSKKVSQRNLQHRHLPYIPSTAHSFCIQDSLYLPCSIATTLHPPTTCILSTHINMHYTPSNTLTTAFHNPAMHTTNKHKI